MNRNQKIALGCGVAGCLGLILVVVCFVVLGVLGYVAIPGTSSRNYNYNYNSNSNYNSNANTNSGDSSSSSSSMTDDDKHKLFQAAGITQDSALIMRVLSKIGFGSGTGADYQQFVEDHPRWALKNMAFIQSVLTPEKARAYVDAHIDD